MEVRFARRVAVLVVLVCALGGCGEGSGEGRGGTAADDAASGQDASPGADTPRTDGQAGSDDGAGAGADTTTRGADTAAADSTAAPDAAACDTDPAACAYPSKGLTSQEIDGYSVDEPVTGRSLPLRARVPEGEGPFPVVIWSHGGGLNNSGHTQSGAWGKHVASHGYVVLHLAHTESDPTSRQAACEAAKVPLAECGDADKGDDDDLLLAVFRALDTVAVLDALPKLSKWSTDKGGPALDLDRIALAGWSGGSRGPAVLMGATTQPSQTGPTFGLDDPRVKAGLQLSPTGPGFGGFYDEGGKTSWDTTRGPVLLMTGENDVKPNKPGLNGPVRRFPFSAMPQDGARWLLYSNLPVGVGEHGTYNLDSANSSDERVLRLTAALRSTALAFLDATLRDDPAAKAWLSSGKAGALAGDADWENR